MRDMSDLSQLLGDLYGAVEPQEAAQPEKPTRAPEWSSDEALDDAFAEWVPGPSDDAPAAERAIVAEVAARPAIDPLDYDDAWLGESEPLPEPTAPIPAFDTDGFEHLSEDVLAAPVAVATVPVAAEVHSRWDPSHDDILPGRKLGGGRSRGGGRTSARSPFRRR